MRRSGFILFYLAALILVLVSSCGPDASIKKGDASFSIGEYFEASVQYKKGYSRTPIKDKAKRGMCAWKMGECFRRINYSAKAIGAYQNAIRYHYPDSMAVFYLAQMQHRQGDYKNAIKNYMLFLDSVPDDNRAKIGIQGCTQAQIWKEKPTNYTVKKEPILTSRRSDFSPVLYGDDWDQLFLTSNRQQAKGNETSGITGTKVGDLFVAKKNEKGKW